MTDTTSGELRRDYQHAWVEDTLGRYPHVTEAELDELKRWFDVTATAMDVAMLASKIELRPQYQQFRADHLDRLDLTDLLKAGLWVALAVLAITAFAVVATR